MKDRAEEILRLLGLTDSFKYVLCADDEEEDYYLKPNKKAFEFVEDFLGIYNRPETNKKIIFFDDSKDNIDTAAMQNWGAILVKSVDHVKKSLNTLYELQMGQLSRSEGSDTKITDNSFIFNQEISETELSMNNEIRQNPCIAST